jgi:hypothetical protein
MKVAHLKIGITMGKVPLHSPWSWKRKDHNSKKKIERKEGWEEDKKN